MKPRILPSLLAALLVARGAAPAVERECQWAVVAAPPGAVWELFTTADGLRKWMAPKVDVELKVGGLIRSTYQPDGELGDASTIENTIIAFDPGRMLAMRNSKCPQGFPFPEAIAKTWSVIYFEPVGEGETKLTIVGLGYGDDEASIAMRAYFKAANAGLLEKLKEVAARPAEGD